MKIRNLRKWSLVIVATLLLFALCWAAQTTLAQGPDSRSPQNGLADTFTYQGRLMDGGAPANGAYDFRFSVYTDEVGGTMLGSVMTHGDVPVANGIFSVHLNPGAMNTVFTGEARWLQTEVRPGASVGAYTTLPRQPITAVPYAWGLRPGAVISAPAYAGEGWMLRADSLGTTYPTASAILGTGATGYAVHGESTGGWGFYGRTNDGYGVAGYDLGSAQGRGYGGYFYSSNGVGVYGESNATRYYTNMHTPGVYGKSANGAGVMGLTTGSSGHAGHFANVDTGTPSSQVGVWAATYWGNIFEGWEVAGWDTTGTWGGDRRFRVSYNGYVYADGSYNCGLASSCFNTGVGADVAERIDTTHILESGDVVEIDPDHPEQFRRSQTPFSTLVAGVVSTNPAITLNNNDLTDNDTGVRSDNRPLLALVGQVPVKVSAENGAIEPGDLLVASSTPGHAMKAGPNPPSGTIIGKALQKLNARTGVIKMLVMLR